MRILLQNMRKKRSPATLIENGFPTKKLHGIALSEGNSKRPVYQNS